MFALFTKLVIAILLSCAALARESAEPITHLAERSTLFCEVSCREPSWGHVQIAQCLTDMSGSPLNIAYYVTGHGLGHATRVVEVIKQLVAAGHSVFVVTAAAATVFTREIPSQQLTVRRAVLDCGSKQQDAFSVDMKGSLELYQEVAVGPRDVIIKAEVEWLQASKIDLVTVDIVPIACAAAAAAGIPAVGVSNFSWGE